MFSVAVVQRYVPVYRLEFFEEVAKNLEREGIRLELFHGQPSKSLKARMDQGRHNRATEVKTLFANWPSNDLSFRLLPMRAYFADLVVIEQATGNLESYIITVLRRILNLPTASWGHGKTITSPQPKAAEILQGFLLRWSTFFLAYTQKSAERARAMGYPGEKITVVNNSHPIMRAARSSKSAAGLKDELSKHLNDRWVALYIGALDESKNLDTLFRACELVWNRHPEFLLVMAGKGETTPPPSPWLKSIGRISDGQKIELARHCQILLNPGRVGLVALDSIALNLPLLTTNWPHHAPEIEYLNESNSLQVENSPLSVANQIQGLISNPIHMENLKSELALSYQPDHFESFVASFCRPIIELFRQKN